MKRRDGIVIWVVCGLSLIAASDSFAASRERSVCGWIKEPFAFYLWRKVAADESRAPVALSATLQRYQITTADKRVLRGFVIRSSTGAADSSKTALVFLQGNAMVAEDVVSELQRFASNGSDVYLLNYRGYGPHGDPSAKSDGTPRLEALIEDYTDFITRLRTQEQYGHVNVFGISLGGIIALNAVGRGAVVDKLVADSVFSRISTLGCPKALDPIAQTIPATTSVLLVSGGADEVIKPADQAELRADAAHRSGWTVVFDPEFHHPFMDPSSIFDRRMQLIQNFLQGAQ